MRRASQMINGSDANEANEANRKKLTQPRFSTKYPDGAEKSARPKFTNEVSSASWVAA